jgi:hypothetical protein
VAPLAVVCGSAGPSACSGGRCVPGPIPELKICE